MENLKQSSSVTQTQVINDENVLDSPVLSIKLKKPSGRKKVKWSSKTVDNENMGKKKSKCCCIYTKPEKFGDPSALDKEDDSSSSLSDDSSNDDNCHDCHGHKGNGSVSKPGDKQPSTSGHGHNHHPHVTLAKIKVLPLPGKKTDPEISPTAPIPDSEGSTEKNLNKSLPSGNNLPNNTHQPSLPSP